MNRKSIISSLIVSVISAGLFAGALTGCGGKKDPAEEYAASMKRFEEFKAKEDWDAARITLINAIEAKPDSAQAYYELAEIMLRQKNYGKAREYYVTSINTDPNYREPRLHLAAFLMAANQVEEAENHIRRLLDANPEDTEALILQAGVLSSRKDYDGARKILESVLSREPENPTAIATLGDVTLAQGNGEEAENLFKKSLELKPNNSPVQLVLADLFMRQGRLDEAQQILETVVESTPENSGLRFYYGEFLLQRGQSDEALEQFSELLKTDIKRHDARDRLYDFHLLKGEVDEAKKLTAELQQADPNDPGTEYFLGRDAEYAGNSEAALKHYLKALQGLPNFAAAFRRAGIIELKQGKTHEGLEHLNQAVAADGNDVGARLALARHFFAQRDMALAKEHVNRVLRAFPRQVGANVLRADIALVEGDIEKAEAVYKALVTALPNNPVGYLKLGFLAEQRKDAKSALENYRKVLEFDREVFLPASRYTEIRLATAGPDVTAKELEELYAKSERSKAEYSLLLSSVRLRKGGDRQAALDEARALVERALKENENLLPAYFALASLDSMSGDTEGAIENYKKLLDKTPQNVPTRMLLAMTYERTNRFEEAAKEYREVLSHSPRFGPAANNLAWIMAEHIDGNLDEALRLAQIGKEMLPKSSQTSDTLGWVHYKRGTTRAALQYLEEAVETERESSPAAGKKGKVNPEILYHLGVVQHALGDKASARKTLIEAKQGAEKNQPLLQKINAELEKLN